MDRTQMLQNAVDEYDAITFALEVLYLEREGFIEIEDDKCYPKASSWTPDLPLLEECND